MKLKNCARFFLLFNFDGPLAVIVTIIILVDLLGISFIVKKFHIYIVNITLSGVVFGLKKKYV